MNDNSALVITSIASPNKMMRTCAEECAERGVTFIVIGDRGSPDDFRLNGCDFWGIDRQTDSEFELGRIAPERQYARKNIGYLAAVKNGAEIIVETDDDNFPEDGFWDERRLRHGVPFLKDEGWINVYRYFTDKKIWPRGFALEHLLDDVPGLKDDAPQDLLCPIQQGLADINPDVDAIYRMALPLPVTFNRAMRVALGRGCWCPFNSQNTSWFRMAFPLLYLPSFCSFRMTDIWRSFVAQRIAWTCDWSILFHGPTVYQERNVHDLLKDFEDEIPGYLNNAKICAALADLHLKDGPDNLFDNLFACYERLVEKKFIVASELKLLGCWMKDLTSLMKG